MQKSKLSRHRFLSRVFAVAFAAGLMLLGAPATQAGSPNAFWNNGGVMTATPRLGLARFGKPFRHQYAPVIIQPRYETFQSFQTVVPTTTLVMVPPTSTRVVAMPTSPPLDPKTISTALPDWYLTTQALRQIPSTGTSGVTLSGSTGGLMMVSY